MRHSKELELSIVLALINSDNLEAIPHNFNSKHFYDFEAKKYAEVLELAKADKTPPEVYMMTKCDKSLKSKYFNDEQRGMYSIAHVSAYSKVIEDFNVREEIKIQEERISKLKNNLEPVPDDLRYESAFDDVIYRPDRLADESTISFRKMKPTKMRFIELNKKIFSFQHGEHMIIGGRSATGKTAKALQLMQTLCDNESEKGIFFSTEMSPQAITRRWFDINWYSKNKGLFTDDMDYDSITRMNGRDFWKNKDNPSLAIDNIPKNITVINKPSLSTEDIKRITAHLQKEDPSYKNICVDFIQNLKGTGDHIEMTRTAYDMKAISLTQMVRVITISQTTRGSASEGGGTDGTTEFHLHNLKGAGGLEESSDFVLGLWKDKEDPKQLFLKVAKDRMNGSEGVIKMRRYGVYFE